MHAHTQPYLQAYVHRLKVQLNWVEEGKVFSILIYQLILTIGIIATSTITLLDHSYYLEETNTYHACVLDVFHDTTENFSNMATGPCDRETVKQFAYPISTAIVFVLLGFYPLMNLVYIFRKKELKKLRKSYGEVEMINTGSWQRVDVRKARAGQTPALLPSTAEEQAAI